MDGTAAARIEELIEHLEVSLAALRSESRNDTLTLIDRIESVTGKLNGTRLALIHQAALTSAAGDELDHRLHNSNRATIRQVRGDIRLARELESRYPLLLDALRNGQLSEQQARAIMTGLNPLQLTETQSVRCQTELIGYATQFDPNELLALATRMVEVIDPDHADAKDAARAERDARVAHASRSLTIAPDHHGSMLLRGRLPLADGELLLTQLAALMPSAESYTHTGERPSAAAKRADALARLCTVAANSGQLPAHGGDRPHVIVTLDYDTLLTGLGTASYLDDGSRLSAREARRLACDADLIPMVLGGSSRPLDVGRSRRYFTKSISTALAIRDRGCAFPGCDAPPSACDRHHTQPWKAGGITSLALGVLLCCYHHRLAEPDPLKPAEMQWQIHFDNNGNPWFTPPRFVDPSRRPRQHHRYRLHGRTLPTTSQDDPPDRRALKRPEQPKPPGSSARSAPPESTGCPERSDHSGQARHDQTQPRRHYPIDDLPMSPAWATPDD